MSDPGLAAPPLVELLAGVSSCADEHSAMRAAVERAAEAVEAEVCGVVLDGAVATAVGLPQESSDYSGLMAAAPGRRGRLELPGMGPCAVGSALLGHADEGMLVLARVDDDFSVVEHNLIRGMARVLGLTLRMLRTLDVERRRERLMRRLYELQRSISHRAPLDEVLQETTAAALDVVVDGNGEAELWMIDPDVPDNAFLVCRGSGESGRTDRERRPLGDDRPLAVAIRTDRLHDGVDDLGQQSIVAPVHEHGSAVGALLVTRAAGRRLADSERDNLRSFAQQVSLALTDAKTVRDMI